jgi:hypothetical protein
MFKWNLAVLATLAGIMTLVGCSNAEQDTCTQRSQCESGEVCVAGACAPTASDMSCTSDEECLLGTSCVNRLCVVDGDDPTPDMTPEMAPDQMPAMNPDMMPAMNPDMMPDPPDDVEPPTIISVNPRAGQTGVAVDARIVITFSEPVREFGLAQKIIMTNADTLDPVTFVAERSGNVVTLQPTAPMLDATPYLVLVTNQVTDERGNKLPDDFRWFFSTAAQAEPAHAEIARLYAPVVFQETSADSNQGRVDRFSSVDVDGNFNADDNLMTFRSTDQPAEAYYTVIETTSHVIVQYLFYYPSYFNSNNSEFHEHDITAVQVLLERTEDGLQFVMTESGYRSQYFGFALEGQGVEDRNQGNLVQVFPESALVDGTRSMSYHGRQIHGACHWFWEPGGLDLSTAPWCSHTSETFRDPNASVVFYPGAAATRMAIACDGNETNTCAPEQGITCQNGICRDEAGLRASTYALRDFRQDLWSRRVNISGEDRLFSGRSTYEPHPNSADLSPGVGQNRKYPATLASNDTGSRGEMPFIWEIAGAVEQGQWWLDPAYTFNRRFRFASGEIDRIYCYNPYFDIDQRGSGDCP